MSNVCPTIWTPKEGDSLELELFRKYVEIPADAVAFDFACPVNCINFWKPTSSSEVNFDRPYHTWVDTKSTAVDFDFVCETDTPVECPQLWVDVPGNLVNLSLKPKWKEQAGNAVHISIKCEGSVDPGFVFFDGYFDSFSGQYADFDFKETFRFDFAEGGIVAGTRSCEQPSPFENFAGSNNVGAIGPDGFVLATTRDGASPTESRRGANVCGRTIDGIRPGDEISLAFRATLTGTVFDNDRSDALNMFGFFFREDASTIVRSNADWHYGNIFGLAGNNSQLSVYIPFLDPSAWQIRIEWDGVVYQTPRPEIDFYGGDVLTRLHLIPGPTGTTVELYADDVLVASNLFLGKFVPGQYAIPAWHFHNYLSAGQIAITDVVACGYDILLNTYPVGGLGMVGVYDGAAGDIAITTEMAIPANVFGGELAQFALATTQLIDDIKFHSDAVASLTLSEAVVASFLLDFYDGGEVSGAISTSNLFDFEFRSGGSVSVNIETHPQENLVPSFFDGASATANLRTITSLSPSGYDGAEFVADIAVNPAADLLFLAAEGAAGSFVLSIAIQLGNSLGYTGEQLEAVLDTLENFNVFDGGSIRATLATSAAMVVDGYAGEEVSVDVEFRSSAGIGTLRFYEGFSSGSDDSSNPISTLPQVLLYPNPISDRTEFFYDIIGQIGIDLNNGTCCPLKDQPYRIELEGGPAADERYDGDKVVVQADLSILPRFKFDFVSGEVFGTIEPPESVSMSVVFWEGTKNLINHIDFEFHDFNLCEGNFIPDGDHVNVELVATDFVCEDSTLIFDGAEVELDIENNVQFQLPAFASEIVHFELEIDRWSLYIWTGEYVRVSNPEFPHHHRAGEYVSIQFEAHDYVAADGEFVNVILSTDYDVEFLEVGCLDNEFVPQDEKGDADWSKFNPVPVELEFFRHSIKARCF